MSGVMTLGQWRDGIIETVKRRFSKCVFDVDHIFYINSESRYLVSMALEEAPFDVFLSEKDYYASGYIINSDNPPKLSRLLTMEAVDFYNFAYKTISDVNKIDAFVFTLIVGSVSKPFKVSKPSDTFTSTKSYISKRKFKTLEGSVIEGIFRTIERRV